MYLSRFWGCVNPIAQAGEGADRVRGDTGATGTLRIKSLKILTSAPSELHCSPKMEVAMTANTVVRARIDARIKKEAEAVLATIGLTVSDAFRLLMVRVAAEKALPFEPLVPNKETIEAIEAARRGELRTAGGAENLLQRLNADD